MSLNMNGHIDGVFQSIPVTMRYSTTGSYVNGIWQDGVPAEQEFTATVQPVTERELDNMLRAGQRVMDARKLYINDGPIDLIRLGEDFVFDGQTWKIIKTDIREWRNYSKTTVGRYDEQ